MRKRLLLTAAPVFLVAAAVVAFLATKDADRSPRKMGAILSITGRGAKYGKASLQGIQIALAEINTDPTFRKFPLILTVEDSKSEAKAAVAAYRKLIDIDKVNAVIGPILSDEVLAVAPEANLRKVLILAPAAGTDKIAEAGPYVFRNRESAMLQSQAIATLLLKATAAQRIAIIYSNTANAISYKDAFLKALGAAQNRVVHQDSFSEGQTDFRNIVAKLKRILPTHVFVPGLAPEIAMLMLQGKQAGMNVQWLSTAGAQDPELLRIAGTAAEGLIFGAPSLETADPNTPTGRLNRLLQEKFKTDVDMFSANAYDAITMLTRAGQQFGFAAEQLRIGLLSTKDFPGAGGTTTFLSPGTVIKPIVLKTVRRGAFVTISPSLVLPDFHGSIRGGPFTWSGELRPDRLAGIISQSTTMINTTL